MNIESYNQILQKMITHFKGKNTKINDFVDGSIIKSIFSAVASVIEQLYIDTRNGLRNNLRNIAYSVFLFKSKAGTKAHGTVIFRKGTQDNKTLTIPKGTKIAAGDLIYVTTETGSITSDRMESYEISIEAAEIGRQYNVSEGSISVISSIVPANVIEVTNPERVIGGEDSENPYDTNVRFIEAINGLSGVNRYAVVSAILESEYVSDCEIEEHFPPKNGYNFTVYFLGDKMKAKEHIDYVLKGNPKNYSEYPGLKAWGVYYNSEQAKEKIVNIEYTLKTSSDDISLEQMITDSITEYISSLKIGQSLVISTLITKLRAIPEVEDIRINRPSDNVDVNKYEVIQKGIIIRNKD